MKRALTTIAVILGVLITARIVLSPSSSSAFGRVDAFKVAEATRAYKGDLQAHGAIVPATVSLQDLVNRGFLKPSDVSGFAGTEVTVYLVPKGDQNPQGILMSVQLKDGSKAALLDDGSAQAFAPNKTSSQAK